MLDNPQRAALRDWCGDEDCFGTIRLSSGRQFHAHLVVQSNTISGLICEPVNDADLGPISDAESAELNERLLKCFKDLGYIEAKHRETIVFGPEDALSNAEILQTAALAVHKYSKGGDPDVN